MAATQTFKQSCPSCETLIPIRDRKLIGKQMECPRCKDKFLVVNPASDDDEDEDIADEAPKQSKAGSKSGKNGSAKNTALKKKTKASAGKPAAAEDDIDLAEEDEVVESDDAEGTEGTEEADDGKKKKDKKEKKKGKGISLGSKKLQLQVALAGVGVLILAVAGYFIVGKPSTSGGGGARPGISPRPFTPGPPPTQLAKKDDKKGKDDGKKVPVVAKSDEPDLPSLPVYPAGPELTNLLPPDSERVTRAVFKNILDSTGPFRDTAFGATGGFSESALKNRLGFDFMKVDELLHAQRFSASGWSFTIVHTMDNLRLHKLTDALGLKPAKAPIKSQQYFEITSAKAWLDQLGALGLGVPPSLRLDDTQRETLFARIHDHQTLIVANERAMVGFLEAEGLYPFFGDESAKPPTATETPMPTPMPKTPPKTNTTPMNPGSPPTAVPPATAPPATVPSADPVAVAAPGTPATVPGVPDTSSPPAPSTSTRVSGAYMTLKPELKELLVRLQKKAADNEKILFISATDLSPAEIEDKQAEQRGLIRYRPDVIWDLTCVLELKRPRLAYLGLALIQKENRKFEYINDLKCKQVADAKDLEKELVDQTSSRISVFFKQILGHEIALPKADAGPMPKINPGLNPYPMTPMVPGAEPPAAVPDMGSGSPGFPGSGIPNQPKVEKKKPLDGSAIDVTRDQERVTFSLALDLDVVAYSKTLDLISLIFTEASSELALRDPTWSRHRLAQATYQAAVKGLSEQNVQPGNFLPGAFTRPPSNLRSAKEPYNRVSWMAGLLPYLGRDELYRQVDFTKSWRDPENWLAGNTIVPEFQDPSYPDRSRFVAFPDLPVEYATTHFVGVAGVGLDAAFYPKNDPAYQGKRGIFHYDQSATVEQVQKGRGLSNTMLMIQVPHNSLVGATPWISGGGSTVRGVPEKNSIIPFVISDKSGKPMLHEGRAGTYALMADGSVRFLTKSTGDPVFQAMATFEGPAPKDFDLNANPNTPLVPDPNAKKVEKAEPSPQPTISTSDFGGILGTVDPKMPDPKSKKDPKTSPSTKKK